MSEEATHLRRELIADIDCELAILATSDARPGWSIYAILASVAGCAWLLLDLLERPATAHRFTIVIGLVVATWLMIDFARGAAQLLGQYPSLRRHNPMFHYSSRLFAPTRPGLALAILIDVGLAVAAPWTRPFAHNWAYFALAWFVIAATGSALVFTMSFLDRPIAPSAADLRVPTILAAVVGVAFIGYSYALASKGYPTPAEFRMAGLIASMMFLVTLLPDRAMPPPLVNQLVDLRREVAFAGVDVARARDRVRIAILGMQVNEVLQGKVNIVLDVLGRAEAEQNMIISNLDALVEYLALGRERPLTSTELQAVRGMLESNAQHDAALKSTEGLFEKAYDAFESSSSSLLGVSAESQASIDGIRRSIHSVIEQAISRGQEIHRKRDQLVAQVQALVDMNKG